MLGGRVIGLAFSALTSVLLARYLGRERLGQYGSIYAYVSLFGFLGTVGLEQILPREVSIRRDRAAPLFYSGTAAALGFAFFAAILAPLLAPFFGYTNQLHWLVIFAAIDLLLLPPLRLPGFIFLVDMRLWYNVAFGLFRQMLWLLAVVLLAFKNAAFYQVIVARTLCGIVEVAITFWVIHRLQLIQGPKRFLLEEARSMLRAAFPIVLSTVAVGIYQRIDQVMLHKMAGDQALGPYVIAVQLSELFAALPIALMSSLFPALSQSATDTSRFDRYLSESYRLLLVLVFGACAVVSPVATPFVRLIYGKQFLETAPLLTILIWSEVPIFFGVILSSAIIAKGLQRWLPFSSIVGACCNVLLNLVLIPRYAASGAAWATVISYSLASIFLFLLFSDTRALTLPGLRIAAPLFLLVLSMTALLYPLSWSPWAKLGVAAFAYLGGVLITKTVVRSDLQKIWAIIRGQSV